jgi:hypothetical protein
MPSLYSLRFFKLKNLRERGRQNTAFKLKGFVKTLLSA